MCYFVYVRADLTVSIYRCLGSCKDILQGYDLEMKQIIIITIVAAYDLNDRVVDSD